MFLWMSACTMMTFTPLFLLFHGLLIYLMIEVWITEFLVRRILRVELKLHRAPITLRVSFHKSRRFRVINTLKNFPSFCSPERAEMLTGFHDPDPVRVAATSPPSDTQLLLCHNLVRDGALLDGFLLSLLAFRRTPRRSRTRSERRTPG